MEEWKINGLRLNFLLWLACLLTVYPAVNMYLVAILGD